MYSFAFRSTLRSTFTVESGTQEFERSSNGGLGPVPGGKFRSARKQRRFEYLRSSCEHLTVPTSPDLRQGEPRWPAMVALLAVSGLFYALPPALKVGPDWVFVVLVAALTVPGAFFHSV